MLKKNRSNFIIMEIIKDDIKDVVNWVSVQIVRNQMLLDNKGVTNDSKKNVKVMDKLLRDISFRLMKIMKKDYDNEFGVEEEEEDIYDKEDDSDDDKEEDFLDDKDEDFLDELVEESDIESDLE